MGERHHDLDAARSVLMMLGCVLHASNVYMDGGDWLVQDPPGTQIATVLSETIHVFRIPAFFVVAGFFAGFSLERYGAFGFLSRRVLRLVVPLATAAVVLGSLQSYVLYRHGTVGYGPPGSRGGGAAGFLAYLGSETYLRTWTEGLWVTHLWFLVYLLVYVVATALLTLVAPVFAWIAVRLARACPQASVQRGLFLFVLPLGAVAGDALAKVVPGAYERVLGVASLADLLAYAHYYLFGLFAYRQRGFFDGLRAPGLWVVAALVLAVMAQRSLPSRPDGLVEDIAHAYLADLVVWLSVALVLAAFRELCARPSKSFAYLSEASYTVYLFHHLCVIALGWAFVAWHVDDLVKLAVVVGTTLALTLGIHHFAILRVRVLRFAFNGKW